MFSSSSSSSPFIAGSSLVGVSASLMGVSGGESASSPAAPFCFAGPAVMSASSSSLSTTISLLLNLSSLAPFLASFLLFFGLVFSSIELTALLSVRLFLLPFLVFFGRSTSPAVSVSESSPFFLRLPPVPRAFLFRLMRSPVSESVVISASSLLRSSSARCSASLRLASSIFDRSSAIFRFSSAAISCALSRASSLR